MTKAFPARVWVLLAVGASMAGAGTWYSTRQGAGISPDSVVYVAAARHVLAGRGFSTPTALGLDLPLTQFPPGYPFVLACALKLTPMTVFSAARWLNILFMIGLQIVLAGWLYKRTRNLALLAALVVMTGTSLDLLRAHAMVWSEPLFLLLTFSGFYLLDGHLEQASPKRLMGGALLLSMAWLTRFAGVAAVVSGLVLLFFRRRSWTDRWKETGLFGAIAAGPMVLWLWRNTYLTAHATTRTFVFHPLWGELGDALKRALILWTVQEVHPSPDAWIWAGVALAVGLLGFVVFGRSKASQGRSVTVMLTFAGFYALMAVIMVLFYEAGLLVPDEFDRILCPMHVALVLAAGLGLGGAEWPVSVRRGVSFFVIAWSLYFAVEGGRFIQQASEEGEQYASHAWRDSPTIQSLKTVPLGTHVYTNGVKPVYFYADRYCYEIPPKIIASTRLPNPNYLKAMATIREEIRRKGAVVVFFSAEYLPEFPTLEELKQLLDGKVTVAPDEVNVERGRT